VFQFAVNWRFVATNFCTLRIAQHSQTLWASVQWSRSNPLYDAYHNCRRNKRQTGTEMSNSVTVLLCNGHNATYVTQKLTCPPLSSAKFHCRQRHQMSPERADSILMTLCDSHVITRTPPLAAALRNTLYMSI